MMATTRARNNNTTSQQLHKLQGRLESALAQHQFYNAHQILRTMHWRLLQALDGSAAAASVEATTPQERQLQIEQLLQLTLNGCVALCEGNEFMSAIDLAELYADTLGRTAQKLNMDNIEKLVELYAMLPATLNDEEFVECMQTHENNNSSSKNNISNSVKSKEQQGSTNPPADRRSSFLNKSIDWALKSANGHPDKLHECAMLQRRFASVLEKEGRAEQGERLNRAAQWLMNEVDRKTQSTSASSSAVVGLSNEAASSSGQLAAERQVKRGADVSDIDLD